VVAARAARGAGGRLVRPLLLDRRALSGSTDDAYVGAKNTTLAAKVSGYVDACWSRTMRMCAPAM
jgi:multidrug resistance efflux pump